MGVGFAVSGPLDQSALDQVINKLVLLFKKLFFLIKKRDSVNINIEQRTKFTYTLHPHPTSTLPPPPPPPF